MAALRHILLVGVVVLVSAMGAAAQHPGFAKADRITPERLRLPKGNTRTSEPFVTRIYKTDDFDRILKPQPKGYPFTITEDYWLKDNETYRLHEGVDISSQPANGQFWLTRISFPQSHRPTRKSTTRSNVSVVPGMA